MSTSKPEALFVYGPAANVRLSMAELAKLQERFSPAVADDWIDRLSVWKAAKGRKTKSDYFTILMWARLKDETAKPSLPEMHTAAISEEEAMRLNQSEARRFQKEKA